MGGGSLLQQPKAAWLATAAGGVLYVALVQLRRLNVRGRGNTPADVREMAARVRCRCDVLKTHPRGADGQAPLPCRLPHNGRMLAEHARPHRLRRLSAVVVGSHAPKTSKAWGCRRRTCS